MTTSFLTPIITEYTQKLEAAVEAAITNITDQLRGAISAAPAAPAARRGVSRSAKPSVKGAKRSPEALELLTRDILKAIRAVPGEGIEKIATRMGVSTRELALPMKKLGAAKSIHTKGQKRATRYYPRGA